ncbi:MAG: PKD domain-containing protein, partial [Bacteroidota bacterium]
TFLDASRGVQKRSWVIDGGDVIEQSNDQMVEGDSLIKVQYDTPGFYTVRLVASLDSSDLFYYETINDTAKDAAGNVILNAAGSDSITCLNCKLVPYAPPGTMDTTFTIQVFDSLQADFTMMQNGVAGETFEAGVPIEFMDASKGTPYGWQWTLRGADQTESTKQNPSAVWKKCGTYEITLRASRPYLEGDINRESDVVTRTITVTPSTAPLEYLDLSVPDGGDFITLSFNQPLVAPPAISEFTVSVNEMPAMISEVSFPNSNDLSLLRLELAEVIPSSSIFQVTSTTNIEADGKTLNAPIDDKAYFQGTGNLFPEGFGDMEGVTSVGVSVLPNTTRNTINGLFTSGSINSEGDTLGSQTYWKRPWPLRLDLTLHSEAIDDPAHVLEGVYSLKWTPGDGGQLDQNPSRGPSFNIETGKSYEVVIWMKAEGGAGDVKIQIKKGGGTVHATGENLMVKDGEWTRLVIPYVGAEDALHNLRFFNNTSGVDYYIDEVSVFEVE